MRLHTSAWLTLGFLLYHWTIVTSGNRIVGGTFAEPNQFPYQAALLKNQNQLHCGGSVIAPQWVVTAAHCLLDGKVPHPLDKFVILAGVVTLDDNRGQRLPVRGLFPHENYGNAFHDIGLVATRGEFLFGDAVVPIALRKTFVPDGTDVVISGWGRTGSGEDISDRLQFTSVRTIPLKECTDRVGITYHGIICVVASEEGQHGPCNGDSGGPAVVDNELVGVANWIYIVCGNEPAGYANVTNYVDWVEKTMLN